MSGVYIKGIELPKRDDEYVIFTVLDKQAGNSIVVNVLMAIFKEMIKEDT